MSSEREISLLSGEAVFAALQRLGFNVSELDVGTDVIADIQRLQPDNVVNMLHGKGGEDGLIQGVLETMNIPYTGSGVLASALAMDKVRSKFIWQRLGLPTADFEILDENTDCAAIIKKYGTVVVKPVSGGSSIGISIVSKAEQLKAQYENAHQFDDEVMLEQYIKGKEFSVGVLFGELLPAIELSTKREFFDYEAKYVDEDTQVKCPPDFEKEVEDRLSNLVMAAYKSLGCSGLARVDVMQNEAGDFFLLEVNTVPGMTSHSFVPMAAREVGMNFDELVLKILSSELDNQ